MGLATQTDEPTLRGLALYQKALRSSAFLTSFRTSSSNISLEI